MSAGNRSRNRPKGFHLSGDACERLNQIVILCGGTESHWVSQAIDELFERLYLRKREVHGPDFWDKCLDAAGHIDRLKRRQRVIKTD